MRKLPLLHLAVIFVLFSAGALAAQVYMPELKKQLKDTYSTLKNEPQSPIRVEEPQPINIELSAPPLSLPVPERVITKEYDNHLYAGENNGFGLIEDENHFKKLIEEQMLVSVNRGVGYEVMELTHSHPYITPHSKKVLEELGLAFQSQMKKESFFTLTSVTRTPEQQESLRKRNRNATSGISSHSYGVSFDISYIRFNGKKGSNRDAQKKLEMILNEFQDSNKIFFIKERKQSCYHVTIR
jgi:hypothetical protein